MKPRIVNQKKISNAEAARRLGCSAPHLWLVLHGKRISYRLERRYHALLKRENAVREKLQRMKLQAPVLQEACK